MINPTGRGVLDTRFRGYDDWAGLRRTRLVCTWERTAPCHRPRTRAIQNVHAPCHRPRRRAIQYRRGADDKSRGRGVLDTRFRGYDDRAGLRRTRLVCTWERTRNSRVIAREGGRSSIPEELMINRGAAAYWIPAFAGMTFPRSSSLQAQRSARCRERPRRGRLQARCVAVHAPCHRPRRRAIQNVHAPCHRPRRRAIQYCRGADDQSRGRGVLDTRFRGYDDWSGLRRTRLVCTWERTAPCHRPRRRAIQNVHAPCHRPRRRAIQYCRGADDRSRGCGVLDTRFRGCMTGPAIIVVASAAAHTCRERPRRGRLQARCVAVHAPCHRPRRRAIQYSERS